MNGLADQAERDRFVQLQGRNISVIAPAGGEVVFPKTTVPNIGVFAHIKDTEGNRIGVFAVK